MTEEEKKSLMEIQGTPGFRVLEYIIKNKIEDLKDVTNIDVKTPLAINVQTLANQKSVKFLQEFLYDLGFVSTVKESKRTYE